MLYILLFRQWQEPFHPPRHESDTRIRTDFKIIATFASQSTGTAQVWMKNIGSERISLAEIQRADVFCGAVGSFDHLAYTNVTLGIRNGPRFSARI